MAILLQAVELWKQSHDGQPPQTSRDRSEFRAILDSMRRKEDSRGGTLEVYEVLVLFFLFVMCPSRDQIS